jgi:hypothetical protein
MLAQGPAKVALEHRQPPVGRGGAGVGAGGEVGQQVLLLRLRQRQAVRAAQPAVVQRQVAPVGRQVLADRPSSSHSASVKRSMLGSLSVMRALSASPLRLSSRDA